MCGIKTIAGRKMQFFRYLGCACMLMASASAQAGDAALPQTSSLFSFQSQDKAAQASGAGDAAVEVPASGGAAPAAASGATPALPVAKLAEHNGPKTATDKIVEKFMALDSDASAGVSLKEYAAMVEQRLLARFAAMDADKDGEVTEDEYRAFWKSRMARWYRLKR